MRVVVVLDRIGAPLGAAEAGQAITTGWHAAAPGAEVTLVTAALPAPDSPDGRLGAALDGAGLAIICTAEFDWQSLRSSVVTAVADAAVERGVPCVVIAERVSVGRREASAIGVDAAYAVIDGSTTAARPSADPPTHVGQAGDAAVLSALAERVARRWSR
ncbi:MAG TPA: glycerate kinase [Pseudonocardia sp.]